MNKPNVPLYRYLSVRVPRYSEVVEALGDDFFEDSPYVAVGRLYDLTVDACDSNDLETARAAANVVEEALRSSDPAVIDVFSINFIEALYNDRNEAYYACLRRLLGPTSLRELDSKASR